MEINQFLRNAEEAIDGVEPNSLTAELDYKNNLAQWDSLAALAMISMIDAKYNIVISAQELDSCRTFKDLYAEVVERQTA